METKLDNAESIFFKKELEQVKNKSYDKKYQELKARKLIPVSNELDAGAEYGTYKQYDMLGVAKIVESYAKDFPRVDIKAKEFTFKVKSLGDSYGYSIQEIRASRYANKGLEQKRANAAKKAIMQKENKIAILGDADHNLGGLLSNANIPLVTPITGNWLSASADQIIADLNKLANNSSIITGGVESPDTLLLPIEELTHISSTPRSATSDTTILEFFLKSNLFIKNVDWLDELKTAGAGSTKRAMTYRRDPDYLELEIPQEFEQFPPHPEAMEFVIHCHERIGGVNFYFPLACGYMDGI